MKQGFSAMEMLVVVLIIGILAAVALPKYQASVERSRTAEALLNGRVLLDSMNRAIALSPNTLPTVKQDLDVKIGGGQWTSDSTFETKDFVYDVSNGSYLEIRRVSQGNVIYSLQLYNRFVPADDGMKICIWNTELGNNICDILASQGFSVQAS